MKNIRIIMLGLFCLAFLLPINTASASDPQKIYITRTVDRRGYGNDTIYQQIDARLKDNFSYPLNSIVNRYQLMPATDAARQLTYLLNTGKQKLNKNTLQLIARTANADIVILPQLNFVMYTTFTTWDGDVIQQTEIEMECYAYTISDDKLIQLKTNRRYHSDYSTQGEPAYLLNDMLDEIIGKLPYGRFAAAKAAEKTKLFSSR